MSHSQFPTAATEPKGTIELRAQVQIMGIWFDALVIEASAETQSCRVQLRGRGQAIVKFNCIQNVALKYADGTVLQNFGAPRVDHPASLEYIQHIEAGS